MNDLQKYPCMLFRGGTSKGAYFLESDLPRDFDARRRLLLRIMGSPHPRQIDGIGGGAFVTSKVALVSRSARPGIDVDYKFIQVMVDAPVIDDQPTCGNLLSAVGVFALERGLVSASDRPDGETQVRVHDINTGATVLQTIRAPGGKVCYQGDARIAGVPGTASPIDLHFQHIAGGKTGHHLPTGNTRDTFDGVAATCLDISMPTVFVRAGDLGKTGHESAAELEADQTLMARIRGIREQASAAMGLGDARDSVIPKFALISAPQNQRADINIRYFTPATCHPAVALSAGFCLAAGCFIDGALMHDIAGRALDGDDNGDGDTVVHIENPSGVTPVSIRMPQGDVARVSGKARRTARLLFAGDVYA